MDVKLTLSLDKTIIEKAKKYAQEHNVSLSSMIENFLAKVTAKPEKKDEIKISPLVKELSGVLNKLPEDFDYKKEYGDYLSKKYK